MFALGQHVLCRLFVWVLWYLIWSTPSGFLEVFLSLTSSRPCDKSRSLYAVNWPRGNLCWNLGNIRTYLVCLKMLWLAYTQWISRPRFCFCHLIKGPASPIKSDSTQTVCHWERDYLTSHKYHLPLSASLCFWFLKTSLPWPKKRIFQEPIQTFLPSRAGEVTSALHPAPIILLESWIVWGHSSTGNSPDKRVTILQKGQGGTAPLGRDEMLLRL